MTLDNRKEGIRAEKNEKGEKNTHKNQSNVHSSENDSCRFWFLVFLISLHITFSCTFALICPKTFFLFLLFSTSFFSFVFFFFFYYFYFGSFSIIHSDLLTWNSFLLISENHFSDPLIGWRRHQQRMKSGEKQKVNFRNISRFHPTLELYCSTFLCYSFIDMILSLLYLLDCK